MDAKVDDILRKEGYRIRERISTGSFGPIYPAKKEVKKKDLRFQVKVSSKNKRYFNNEYHVWNNFFKDSDLVVKITDFISRRPFTFIVTQRLGSNVKEIIEQRKEKGKSDRFIRKEVSRLAPQMLACIQVLHSKGIIHRNITPACFSYARSSEPSAGNSDQMGLLISDFEFAKSFRQEGGEHMPQGDEPLDDLMDRTFKSANAHQHVTQSRRDDLISLSYVLFSLLRPLPWHDWKKTVPTAAKKTSKSPKNKKDKKAKRSQADPPIKDQVLIHLKSRSTPEALSAPLGHETRTAMLLRRVLSLSFDQEPDYAEYTRYFGHNQSERQVTTDAKQSTVKDTTTDPSRAPGTGSEQNDVNKAGVVTPAVSPVTPATSSESVSSHNEESSHGNEITPQE